MLKFFVVLAPFAFTNLYAYEHYKYNEMEDRRAGIGKILHLLLVDLVTDTGDSELQNPPNNQQKENNCAQCHR